MKTIANTLPVRASFSIQAGAAWGLMLAVSSLPDILFRELTGSLPGWLYWMKVALLAVLLATAFAWNRLRSLRLYFAALLGLYVIQWGVSEIFTQLNGSSWFAGRIPFVSSLLSVEAPRVAIAFLMVLYLLALTRDLSRFYFVPGLRDAIASPIPGIMTQPTPWKRLGPIVCICLLAGMAVITWLMGTHPGIRQFAAAAPLLPWILLFAASNAFGEELSYRATLLAGLAGPLGSSQALGISAVILAWPIFTACLTG